MNYNELFNLISELMCLLDEAGMYSDSDELFQYMIDIKQELGMLED